MKKCEIDSEREGEKEKREGGGREWKNSEREREGESFE